MSLTPPTSVTHTIVGSPGDDRLPGTADPDRVFGDARILFRGQHGGDDTIAGHAGSDTLYGDAGTIVGGASGGADVIHGGSGGDLFFGDAARVGGPEVSTPGTIFPLFFTFLGSDTLSGGNGDDTIWGDAAAASGNVINGNDLLRGGGGDDVLHGDGPGTFTGFPPIPGPVLLNSADTLIGGKGNDTLYGDGGNDVLIGGAGDDWLDGGLGADTITGGAGHDTFVVRTDDTGNDVFTDFRSGVDRILIIAIVHPPGASSLSIHSVDTADGLQLSFGDETLTLQGVHSLGASDILIG